jgi:hypothetical protein
MRMIPAVPMVYFRKSKRGEDGGDKGNPDEVNEQNVIGEVSNSVGQHKFTHKRKITKKSSPRSRVIKVYILV